MGFEHTDEMSRHLKLILREMCDRVDTCFWNVDFNDSFWFREHTWSRLEEKSFAEWMEDYLYNNAGARREIMSFYTKKRSAIRSCVFWFLFCYGWKYKEEAMNEPESS